MNNRAFFQSCAGGDQLQVLGAETPPPNGAPGNCQCSAECACSAGAVPAVKRSPLFRFSVPASLLHLHPENELEAFFTGLLSGLLDVVSLVGADGELLDPAGYLFTNELSQQNPYLKKIFAVDRQADTPTAVSNKEEADLRGGQEGFDDFYDPKLVVRTEPRVEFIERTLTALNRVASVEVNDERITAFSLRDPDQWVCPSQGDPYEVIASLSRNCNARCVFCYVHGNPKDASIRLNSFSTTQSLQEAELRLDYYSAGKTLLPPTYDLEEILLHPGALQILERLRAVAPNDLISLTTNGYTLGEEAVRRLAALEPVELTISLNATTPDMRQRLMGGRSELGINGIRRVAERGIRFTTTLVAWPTVPVDELIATTRFADSLNVRIINVIQAGYTRLFRHPPEFEVSRHWTEIVTALTPLRAELAHPLIIQPGLFTQQFLYPANLNGGYIAGVSPLSPAAVAGLRPSDLIERVNGISVMSRPHCLSLLGNARDDERTHCLIRVRGTDDQPRVVEMQHEAASSDYLYGPPINDRFGIFLEASGITVSAIRQLFRIINGAAARHVVVITSYVVQPHFEAMVKAWSFLCGPRPTRIESLVPENHYYGGNIVLGDLFTVDDIADAVHDYIAVESKPDLVVVPSASFNYGGWRRDIRGTPFHRLQRALSVRCELLVADNFE